MYIALLIIILFLSLVIKNQKKYIFVIGILLFLIASLRAESVGSDLTSYLSAYHMYKSVSVSDIYRFKYEPLFALLYFVIQKLHGSFRMFMVVCAGITLAGPVYFIKKYSKIPWLSFFLYVAGTYYFSTLSMLRGCIGMSISMFAIDSFIEKKYKKAIFIWVIACLFHYSAIIVPLFAFFMLCSKNKIKFFVSVAIILISFLGKSIITRLFVGLYASSYGSDFKNFVVGTGYNMLLIFIFLWILGVLFGKKSEFYKVFDSLMLSAIVCQIIATSVSLFTREARFFIIPAVLLTPSILFSFGLSDKSEDVGCLLADKFYFRNESNNLILLPILMALFLVLFISYVNGDDSTGVLPYIFAEMRDLALWVN